MKKQTKILLIAAIILVIAIIFLFPRFQGGSTSKAPVQTAESAPEETPQLPVNVKEVQPERLENNLNITGNVLSNESVSLRAEITGLVESINFKEGQFVKKGTPLVRLNDNELTAQLDRLEYTKKLYEGQENRQKQLLAREAISQEEYDVILNQYNTTLSDIKLVKAQLDKTVIKAPFDGVVGLRQISAGSVISTTDIIANIVNINPIKIEFSIPERYTSEVRIGSSIRFSNNASDGLKNGKVYAYEPVIDANTRTLTLRAISSNDDRKFLPGMFVNIHFNLGVDENALMVPSESLIPELNGYKLFLVNKEGIVEERKVTIGIRTDRQVQITDGLTPGDLVLTTGVLQAKAGMQVKYNKIN
ncbi:efflux transporter periplasmic adaptor subunit [Echinicola strongylocentroti]|uniref:Efflux transporter periplasmic adaptor subunit n=1 Tax=Echinicola strongylocentroti TaxID=1795355 RepID=A0A2Z4II18_9BACT|nr:efflux RND transporter periplasmic adaptor subunit [Echinicola strongylocentroti]AWW30379.1 efflux transporter periplasmic adaptor subunit [Echinicola strongylocentroti]